MQREILVLVECNEASLPTKASLSALTFARDLGKKQNAPIVLVIFGHGALPLSPALTQLWADAVLFCKCGEDEAYPPLAEMVAPILARLVATRNTGWLIGAATSHGKDLLPRVAGLLDVAFVGDCCGFDNHDGRLAFIRPVYAGNASAMCLATSECVVITVRQSEFAPSKADSQVDSSVTEIQRMVPSLAENRVKWLNFEAVRSNRPALGDARVVVAGGRALSDRFFEVLAPLADRLGAAIGATRAACDAGYAPNDFQVGQTGKVVAPDLYIAVGISGAVQHIAGIRSARVVVAINNDPQAPIFGVADYGIVGDLFKVVPELVAASTRRKAGDD